MVNPYQQASQPSFPTDTHTHLVSVSLPVSCCVFFTTALLHLSFSVFLCIKDKHKVAGNFTSICFSLSFARSSTVCQSTYQKQHEVWLHRKRHTIIFLWRSIYITQNLLASTGGGCLLSNGPQSSVSVQFYFPEKKSGNSQEVCELFYLCTKL